MTTELMSITFSPLCAQQKTYFDKNDKQKLPNVLQ